jgi:hypothetical protein
MNGPYIRKYHTMIFPKLVALSRKQFFKPFSPQIVAKNSE